MAVLLSLLAALVAQERVIHVAAQRYEFSPATIELKIGEPVILELTTLDRAHGFAAPDLAIDEKIKPGETTRVRLTPDKRGTFEFHCAVFCGSGHEEMTGTIIVR